MSKEKVFNLNRYTETVSARWYRKGGENGGDRAPSPSSPDGKDMIDPSKGRLDEETIGSQY